jgi:CheY-like chemotaxis protein
MQSRALPAVLIVEDEFLIRMDAVDMIRDAGFKTYDASSADQAIVLMDQHPDIGILFTDIDMPARWMVLSWQPMSVTGGHLS